MPSNKPSGAKLNQIRRTPKSGARARKLKVRDTPRPTGDDAPDNQKAERPQRVLGVGVRPAVDRVEGAGQPVEVYEPREVREGEDEARQPTPRPYEAPEKPEVPEKPRRELRSARAAAITKALIEAEQTPED